MIMINEMSGMSCCTYNTNAPYGNKESNKLLNDQTNPSFDKQEVCKFLKTFLKIEI